MNPLVLVRSLLYIALPVALLLAARHRPRPLGGEPDTDDRRDLGVRLELLPKMSLRDYLDDGGDPHLVELRGAGLDGLSLTHTSLDGVNLTSASLREANLTGATLDGAVLHHADLSRARLDGAQLGAADVLEANLRKSSLTGADLSSVRNLSMANLRGAAFDRATRWPPGFDPEVSGARQIG